MHENQRVSEMAQEVLSRQAGFRAESTGESFEAALEAVLQTRAGRYLEELRKGAHGEARAETWQAESAEKRATERRQARQEERNRAEREAAWKEFMRVELREIELRKNGQLSEQLGEPLPGEPSAALQRLAYQDRRQAEEGLVALMSGGKLSYKRLDELSPEDMPARAAAERLRTTWLKGRRDGWLAHGGSGEAL